MNYFMVNENIFTMAFDDGVVKFMNMHNKTFYFDNNFHYACKTHAPSITYHPIQLFIYLCHDYAVTW